MSGLSAYLVLAIFLVVLAMPFLKTELKRRYLSNLLLFLCTCASLLFFSMVAKGEGGGNKVKAQVSENRAESALMLMTTVNVGIAKVYELFGPLKDSAGKAHDAFDLGKTGMTSYFKSARSSLQEAIKNNPDNTALKTKLVVLLSVWGRDRKLIRSTCEDLMGSSKDSDKKLAYLLLDIYVNKQAPENSLSESVKILKESIPKGWYQDYAVLSCYKTFKDFKGYKLYIKELEERYSKSFRTGLAIAVFACFSAFVGLVVIVIQLGLLSRKDRSKIPETEKLGLEIAPRKIYGVFVAWLSCQLAIIELMKLLPKNMLSLGTNPLGIASFSFLIYLLTMSPAIIFIYVLVFDTNFKKMLQDLRLRLRTSDYGPLRILLSGLFSWTALIPAVMMAASISAYLGLSGSDNPVLPQIAALVSSGDKLAVLILLFTVAVLAPIFEEVIFRGFLYASVRNRIGIFPALLLSAGVFAAVHCDKGGTLMLFAIGLVLGLSFERSRSLLAPMIAHGLWNAGTFAFSVALYG